jgi:hypothetical protein
VLREGEVIRVPIRKHVPPDTGACMNWLKNRMPDKWRDRVDHDVNANFKQITRIEQVFIDPPKREAPTA